MLSFTFIAISSNLFTAFAKTPVLSQDRVEGLTAQVDTIKTFLMNEIFQFN